MEYLNLTLEMIYNIIQNKSLYLKFIRKDNKPLLTIDIHI
jgi:hypothetical protein